MEQDHTHKLIDSMTVLLPSQAVIATVGISKIKKQKTEENVNGAFPGYCYVVIGGHPYPSIKLW